MSLSNRIEDALYELADAEYAVSHMKSFDAKHQRRLRAAREKVKTLQYLDASRRRFAQRLARVPVAQRVKLPAYPKIAKQRKSIDDPLSIYRGSATVLIRGSGAYRLGARRVGRIQRPLGRLKIRGWKKVMSDYSDRKVHLRKEKERRWNRPIMVDLSEEEDERIWALQDAVVDDSLNWDGNLAFKDHLAFMMFSVPKPQLQSQAVKESLFLHKYMDPLSQAVTQPDVIVLS